MTKILIGTDANMTPAQLAGALALRSDRQHFGEDKLRYALRHYLSEAFQDALKTYALANGKPADGVRVAVMSNNTADVHYCLKGRESVRHETYAANSLRQLVAEMNEHLLKPLQIRPIGYQTALDYIRAMHAAMKAIPDDAEKGLGGRGA